MSASQAERRRFESGHPLEQIKKSDQLRLPQDERGLINCNNLWANASRTTLLVKSFKNHLSRFRNLTRFSIGSSFSDNAVQRVSSRDHEKALNQCFDLKASIAWRPRHYFFHFQTISTKITKNNAQQRFISDAANTHPRPTISFRESVRFRVLRRCRPIRQSEPEEVRIDCHHHG